MGHVALTVAVAVAVTFAEPVSVAQPGPVSELVANDDPDAEPDPEAFAVAQPVADPGSAYAGSASASAAVAQPEPAAGPRFDGAEHDAHLADERFDAVDVHRVDPRHGDG